MDLLLTDVEIPEGTIEITETTFHNHRLVASVKIPDSVLVIRERAFADCVNLKKIELPAGIMAIAKGAFYNCANLESVNIPEQVSTIEEGVFEDCSGLESIVLPENVTAIRDRAFKNCTGIKNLVLPDNLISCSATAFPNSRKYLPINKNYKYQDGMMINTYNNMLLFYTGEATEVKTPKDIKGIAFRAFSNSGVKSVRVREGVTSISDEAFVDVGCETKVILPESVDYIDNSAFDKNVKVYCHKGSYAEGWCRNNPDYSQLADEEA
ncbi:MAG: leucine-rich repeat domain-containing protein [Treponema sp.]|nr:leucine-rich repeat domain-containing protein [Treponema sp.]